MKMKLTPYENLKGFMSSRPPVVVFMICLGCFGIVLMSLAYYVKVNALRNPDITQDWNLFLDSFAELEFCMTGNYSDPSTAVTPPPSLALTPDPDVKATTTHSWEIDTPRNYSVSLLLSIQPTLKFLSIPHNVTRLYGTLYGKDLGLKGIAATEPINISADLPFNWNNTQCQSQMGCRVVKILTCVTFHGLPVVFPVSRSPATCLGVNETGVEYNARIVPNFYKKSHYPVNYCKSKPVITVQHTYNPSLTVLLSMHDRSVINLHLMHTSYFLFVMVVTLLCYAIIRGRPQVKVIKYSPQIDAENGS